MAALECCHHIHLGPSASTTSKITARYLPVGVHPNTVGRPLLWLPIAASKRIAHDRFRLLNRDTMLSNVLDVAFRILFQVPDKLHMDHRAAL